MRSLAKSAVSRALFRRPFKQQTLLLAPPTFFQSFAATSSRFTFASNQRENDDSDMIKLRDSFNNASTINKGDHSCGHKKGDEHSHACGAEHHHEHVHSEACGHHHHHHEKEEHACGHHEHKGECGHPHEHKHVHSHEHDHEHSHDHEGCCGGHSHEHSHSETREITQSEIEELANEKSSEKIFKMKSGQTVNATYSDTTISYSIDSEILGVKARNPEHGQLVLMFTCTVCDTRSTRSFTKKAYNEGVVLLRCSKCDNLHLIADNLGWFNDEPTNIETIMEEKGEKVLKIQDREEINDLLSFFINKEQQEGNTEQIDENKKE